jgi:hypothetical protein
MTGYQIFSLADPISKNLVRIKQPYRLRNLVFDLKYGPDNINIYIQTPNMMSLYGLEKNGAFLSTVVTTNDDTFKTMMNDIEQHVYSRLHRKYNISHGKERTSWKVSNDIRNIHFYDSNRNRISSDDLRNDDKMIMIWHLDAFDERYGLVLKLLQIQRIASQPPPPTPLPPPIPAVAPTQTSGDDMPEKYKKMLAMGIPLAAVKQKMAMDQVGLGAKPPVTLKAVQPSTQAPAPLKPSRMRVPSLMEIISALKNLRRVK